MSPPGSSERTRRGEEEEEEEREEEWSDNNKEEEDDEDDDDEEEEADEEDEEGFRLCGRDGEAGNEASTEDAEGTPDKDESHAIHAFVAEAPLNPEASTARAGRRSSVSRVS